MLDSALRHRQAVRPARRALMDGRLDLDQALLDPAFAAERVLEVIGWAQIGWAGLRGTAAPASSALAIARVSGVGHHHVVSELDDHARATVVGAARVVRQLSP
jgi:hypothetical protein